MSKTNSTNTDRLSPCKSSATAAPSSPSPNKGKRPIASQSVRGPPPFRKKSRFEQEVLLKILLPNETEVQFRVDSERIHSVDDLLDLVKNQIRSDHLLKASGYVTSRPVEWGPNFKLETTVGQGKTELNDKTLFEMMRAAKRSGTITFLLNDGREDWSYSDPDMWDVTPKPELLGRHPQGYTLETALADHVDNAIQAVFNIQPVQDRLVSVNLSPDQITIFDTGPGMDANENGGNCIKNWGTMGASTHRAVHHNAVGGDAPFLTPYLGKYGVGGISAAFYLGECVEVFSTTRESDKVVSLRIEPKKLVQRSRDESSEDFRQEIWRVPGRFRNMTKEERAMSPQNSFTKVVITKLKQRTWKVDNVRQLLKDIYDPYIQTEQGPSNTTIFPLTLEVNSKNLAEVSKCEAAISKLHTCNGRAFVINIHLKKAPNRDREKGKATTIEAANARISCQYYPNLKGKEQLEAVVEELHLLRPNDRSLTFDNINRVTLRWLGRLLPDVKWPVFPFMEPPAKKEPRALRRWAKRVRAYVDTDAGFYPVQTKTDLDRGQPFVEVIKNIGGSFDKALEVEVCMTCGNDEVKPSELGDLYLKWLTEMHNNYDEEFVKAEDDEESYIFRHDGNCFKDLGVGDSQYIILHTHMKDSKNDWKVQPIPIFLKIPKGPGLKADKFVTLEYFFEYDDDRGLQLNFLCRGIEVDASEGCQLTKLPDGNDRFKVNGSEWFPATMLDTATRLDVAAWKKKGEEISNKLPGTMEVLNDEESSQFELREAFPVRGSTLEAGFSLPTDFIVVVRPRKGSGATFKQGCIVPNPMAIKLTVRHCSCSNLKAPHTYDDHTREVCTLISKSTSKNGVKGLYVLNTESSELNRLVKQGTYTFQFTLESEKHKDVRPAVYSIEILPSAETTKWTFCNHPVRCTMADHENTQVDVQPLIIRLSEPVKQDLFLQKYDQYGNNQDFKTPLELDLVGFSCKGESLHMRTEVRTSIVAGTQPRHRLLVKDILFANASLNLLGSTHEAVLRVCLSKDQQVDIKCKVLPGALENVEVSCSEPPVLVEFMRFEESLKPGDVIRNLTLQGLDSCRNSVEKGQKLRVLLEGVEFQDNCGIDRVVDENGTLQLGGLLKVTCLYNSTGSIAFYSDTKFISSITFTTVTRRLRAYQVPVEAYVGRNLEGISVKMVDENDNVDTSVNADQSITVDWQHGLTYPFIKGECVLPSFQMPEKHGAWQGNVSLTADKSLNLTIMVELKLATASSLGPARKVTKEILTAECGMPIVFPFRAYDDNQKQALLTDSQRENLHVSFEPQEDGDENHSVFRPITVEHEKMKMLMVDGIHTYEAHIVVSGSVGIYMMTLEDKSRTLDGKAQSLCRLRHGRIAELALARFDSKKFQDYEEGDEGPLPIIEVKKGSHVMPDFVVTLLDSADNVCSACDGRTLTTRLLEWPQCKVPAIQITKGIAKLKCSDWEAPVGKYHVVIELERSAEEFYSLEEEQLRPLQAHISFRIKHGNYPVEMRLLDSDPVFISLSDEEIQYLPPVSILIKSGDGLRFESRPKVGVKLRLGDGSLVPSVQKEYFGELLESCDTEVKSAIRLNRDQDLSSYQCRYNFSQVCAPFQAGTYRMEFFIVGSDVSCTYRTLIVRHGPPNTIVITPRATGRAIKDLTVKIVDVHCNACESVCGLPLNLKFTLRQSFALDQLRQAGPCTIFSKCTTYVDEGNGDFGAFQITEGIPGIYTLEIYSEHREGEMDLQPLIVHVCAIKGNINQSLVQLLNQNRDSKVIQDCERRMATSKKEIRIEEKEIHYFQDKIQNLEVELESHDSERKRVAAQEREQNDAGILQAEKEHDVRSYHSVLKDLRQVAQNTAALTFWELLESRILSREQRTDFVGLVVMLARVENDALNRVLAEYLGKGSLLLIVTRTQQAIDQLEVHDAYGELDENSGLHGFARSRGYSISARFEALALTDISPYQPDRGTAVNMEHCQRILNIDPPLLPSRQVPAGFLGYAVNLVYLTFEHLQMRVNTKFHPGDVGLRESLFFHLLRKLQVYDTRRNMISAKENIGKFEGGAISLDGGVIKPSGRQRLGRLTRNEFPIRFGLVPYEERIEMGSMMPPACVAIERRRKCLAIDSRIAIIQQDLSSLQPNVDKGLLELNKLKRRLNQYEQQHKVAQESSKLSESHIVKLQRAAHAEAAMTGSDIRKRETPDTEVVISLKMQAFVM